MKSFSADRFLLQTLDQMFLAIKFISNYSRNWRQKVNSKLDMYIRKNRHKLNLDILPRSKRRSPIGMPKLKTVVGTGGFKVTKKGNK